MKTDRPGDWLWMEWDGYGYEPDTNCQVVYVTHGDLNFDDDIVRRALASALQRDGVATSLGDGYKLVESSHVVEGHSGYLEDDDLLSLCDEDGQTEYGEFVEEPFLTTWVEIV